MTSEIVIEKDIVSEMKSSFIDYSMSIITDRAIPDVRDGLKPVHRRIVYSMWEQGVLHNVPFRKAARVVGDVLGRYHCHGDTSVFDAIVRMVQPFSLRYPLVDGQGNFGSIDGDSAAAMRYVECRLSKIAEETIVDIDKNTIDFMPNYDATLQEPKVLPSKLPTLLLNGATGIAVGMACNFAPHNINEVCDAIIANIDNPDITLSEIVKYLPAPDFPTGGTILGKSGILQAYETGRGAVVLQAKSHIEDEKRHQQIVFDEMPYMTNKSVITESIADLAKAGTIDGIGDIRDESDKDGIRLVIEIKNGYDANIILNQLHKYTSLQTTFNINMVALVNGVPKTLSLKNIIGEYISHRQIVITRRTQFELDQAERRLHILQGLLIALRNIDEVVRMIKAAENTQAAKESLIAKFALSEEQTKAILDMKLSRLTSLEQGKIQSEATELETLIAKLKAILLDKQAILDIIKSDLLKLKEDFGDARRTKISGEEVSRSIEIEELIQEEDAIVTISADGYIKRSPLDVYRLQRRGGKGSSGASLKAEDCVTDLFQANTKDYLLAFTDIGKVHWLKVYNIPEVAKTGRGKPIKTLIKLDGETIMAVIPVRDFTTGFVMAAMKSGHVTRMSLSEFANPRNGGIKAIKVGNDKIAKVLITTGSDEILLASKLGKAVRINENDIRQTGRWAAGVRGMKIGYGDEIITMEVVRDPKTLLIITNTGYGKRTELEEYAIQNRGGSGMKSIELANNSVVGVLAVSDEDELLVTTKQGTMIRIPVNQVRIQGRVTRGVRIMDIAKGDEIAAVALLS